MFIELKREGEALPSTLEPWRQLLLAGASYMEKHGHCVGEPNDEMGRVCLYGSLSKVDPSYGIDITFQIVKRFSSLYGQGAVEYSDTHTGPEVIAAMRACARQGI